MKSSKSELGSGSTFVVDLPFEYSVELSSNKHTTAVLPPFDEEALIARLSGDMELIHNIIEIFFKDTPPRLTQIVQAIAQNDATTLEYTAHALKGRIANFGAERAKEAALELESMGRTEIFDKAPEAFEILKQTITELEIALQRLLQSELSP